MKSILCPSCTRLRLPQFFGPCKSNKNGLLSRCQFCISAENEEVKANLHVREHVKQDADMKMCNKCSNCKHIRDFNLSKGSRDGLQHYCRMCNKDSATLRRTREQKTHRIAPAKKVQPVTMKSYPVAVELLDRLALLITSVTRKSDVTDENLMNITKIIYDLRREIES